MEQENNNKKLNSTDRELAPPARLLAYGPQSLSDRELLSLTIKQDATYWEVDTAGRLLSSLTGRDHQTGNPLQQLAEASLEELTSVVSLQAAITIKAAMELGRRLGTVYTTGPYKITNPTDVYDLIRSEVRFWVVLLDGKNYVIATEIVSIGDINSTAAQPREVFKPAIKRSAVSVVLVHNHPSGDTAPSKEDLLLTERLVAAGGLLGIRVADHIIFAKKGFVSLRSLQLI